MHVTASVNKYVNLTRGAWGLEERQRQTLRKAGIRWVGCS
jgi:hypothetical protein